jgi:hypothetical protein
MQLKTSLINFLNDLIALKNILWRNRCKQNVPNESTCQTRKQK